MNGSQLFVQLLLRLQHFAEAAVLWVLLKEWADVEEFKTSAVRMAYDQLPGTINRRAAQQAFRSLQARGLIGVRIHRKTATLIRVNREAVFDLLDTEMDERLPGLSQHVFPFLEAWDAEHARRTEARKSEAEAAAARAASQTPSEVNERVLKHLEQSSDHDDH